MRAKTINKRRSLLKIPSGVTQRQLQNHLSMKTKVRENYTPGNKLASQLLAGSTTRQSEPQTEY